MLRVDGRKNRLLGVLCLGRRGGCRESRPEQAAIRCLTFLLHLPLAHHPNARTTTPSTPEMAMIDRPVDHVVSVLSNVHHAPLVWLVLPLSCTDKSLCRLCRRLSSVCCLDARHMTCYPDPTLFLRPLTLHHDVDKGMACTLSAHGTSRKFALANHKSSRAG